MKILVLAFIHILGSWVSGVRFQVSGREKTEVDESILWAVCTTDAEPFNLFQSGCESRNRF